MPGMAAFVVYAYPRFQAIANDSEILSLAFLLLFDRYLLKVAFRSAIVRPRVASFGGTKCDQGERITN
jgi:hypothetical protein